MSASNNALDLIFILIDAHLAQDSRTLVESFKALAVHGASGTVSGLLVQLRMSGEDSSEIFLEIVSMFAKRRVSSAEMQTEIIHVLQVL